MNSIFLSEKIIFRQLKKDGEPESKLKGGTSLYEIESGLRKKFAKKYKDVHFDRLPSCPMCLEKLDQSVTGLQQAPSQLTSINE